MRGLLRALLLVAPLYAQVPCPPTPTYSPCDLTIELNDAEAAEHPSPYLSVAMHAEFRSPRHKTHVAHAFWDGGRKIILRFTPTEEGEWDYRITSNISRLNNQLGKVTAVASNSQGFVRPANVHHWRWTESMKQHLWMGDTVLGFGSVPREAFDKLAEARAKQKFNHLRGSLFPSDHSRAMPAPDRPDPAWFREMDSRIRALNEKDIIVDLVVGGPAGQLLKALPTWQDRERFLRYAVARYGPMNITWQVLESFEQYPDGRALAKELAGLLQKFDSYQHPRTAHADVTSSTLTDDSWPSHIVYNTPDITLGAVERQLFALPAVNTGIGREDSGGGKTSPADVDTDTFRRLLWGAAMNGHYPYFANTATSGATVDPAQLDSPAARQMTIWFDFFSGTRYWELEPYFGVDGGRAVALEDIEYIVYVEKPSGPVEVAVARHGYDVAWFNPIDGQRIPQKDFKGERFVAEPPDSTHDWVLHISREGRKQSMLNSYKFESRPVPIQEIERNPQRVPYDIVEPASDTISLQSPPKFAAKVKRETRGTRAMLYLWTGEVAADGQGARVLGTGSSGTLKIPRGIAKKFPAVMNLRVTALNANGKAYSIDRVYRLTE